MVNFIKWFKTRGWKSYTLAWVIIFVIDCGVFLTDGGIQTAFSDPDIPPFIWVFTCIAFIGCHVGIMWHMITSYKLQRNDK